MNFCQYKKYFYDFFIEPQWGEWSSLSECTNTSQGCMHERSRSCNNTGINLLDQNCTGLAVENFSCNCPTTPIGPCLIFFALI